MPSLRYPTFALSGLLVSSLVFAADLRTPGASVAPQVYRAASPAERGDLIRRFVRKWGAYVQQTHQTDVRTWSMRLVPRFAHGDSANLRAALERDTFEGAMAALDGRGHLLADPQVIDALSKAGPDPVGGQGRVVAKALGDVNQDLVYNPIQPCRIVDTRSTTLGAIPANGSRSFLAAGVSNFANQGGSATNCGLNMQAPTAVAINVTAVTPTTAGFATVYPHGAARPETASVNYAAGEIVNNAIITAIPTPVATFDFTIYTFAQAHYVVDIVGYFDNPRHSPVECVAAPLTEITIGPGLTNSVTAAAACPPGYGDAGVNCESSSWDMPLVNASGVVCSAKNNGGANAQLRAGRRCCRISGRAP